jgi:hypothetical protein
VYVFADHFLNLWGKTGCRIHPTTARTGYIHGFSADKIYIAKQNQMWYDEENLSAIPKLAWTGPMTFEMCSFYIEQDHAEN